MAGPAAQASPTQPPSAAAGEVAHAPSSDLPSRKLAVWLFLGSEILFFSALIFTFVVMRATSANWPSPEQVQHVLNIPLTAINTFILIVSSFSVVMALDAIQHDNRRGMRAWLLVTLVLGAVFLSIQAYEYSVLWGHEGLRLTETPIEGTDVLFATTFYTMTGFHGLHVLGGVLTLALVVVKAFGGHYSRENHMGVELFGLYWHFVDVVWIILFTIVYLI